MYDYVKDKEFLKTMRRICSNIVNQLVQLINSENYLRVEANIVGSGAKNMETQNASEAIDLDYNLVILKTINVNINDCESIKEYVRKSFNKVLTSHEWGDCSDSTSALSTKKRCLTSGNKTPFSIDLAIICENEKGWYRLIHDKIQKRYYWNEGPNSKYLLSRVDILKQNNLWEEVRKTYLKKKNLYLKQGDNNHPSFICYIEAVNEVYNTYK